MARKRSDDYEAKVGSILEAAASLFAERGYMGCSIEDIAEKCAISRSLVFYYFPKKDDILFSILKDHILLLQGTLQQLLAEGPEDGEAFFLELVERYLDLTLKAPASHAVTLNDRRFLPPDLRASCRSLEREVLTLVAQALARVNDGLDDQSYRVSALLLMGMINSTRYWLRPENVRKVARQICDLFLPGFKTARAESLGIR